MSRFKSHITFATANIEVEGILDGVVHDYAYDFDGCNVAFDTFAGLRAHQATAHKMYNPIRYRLDTTRCLSCDKQFHTISRAYKHVAYGNPVCKAFYLARDPILDNDKVEDLMLREQKAKKALGIKQIAPPAI